MHAAGDDADAVRLRWLIVALWRAGLRISQALALSESDLDPSRGAILVRGDQTIDPDLTKLRASSRPLVLTTDTSSGADGRPSPPRPRAYVVTGIVDALG